MSLTLSTQKLLNVSGQIVTNVSGQIVTNVSGQIVTNVSGQIVTNVSGQIVTNRGLTKKIINAGNFLTSCKVYWLASQERLCSME